MTLKLLQFTRDNYIHLQGHQKQIIQSMFRCSSSSGSYKRQSTLVVAIDSPAYTS